MTYPPQQPGQWGQQDPYGQQGQWGQQGPDGQQGQWGQQDPYGQQGQWGQQDPHAQQGQQGRWGQQQDPYAQQNPWGQQPGGAYPPSRPDPQLGYHGMPTPQYGQYPGYSQFPDGPGEPPKKRTGLVVGIIAAVVLVVGGGVTALVLFTGKDDKGTAAPAGQPAPAPSSSGRPSASKVSPSPSKNSGTPAPGGKATPEETAQAVAQAYDDADQQGMQDLICLSTGQKAPVLPTGITVTVRGAPEVDGDSALVPITATGPGGSKDLQIGLLREGGVWCYAGDKPS